MAKVNQLTGSPWHTEKMTRKEGDPRRHRSKCAHYLKSTDYCTRQCMKCTGSGHCDYYREESETVPVATPVPKQMTVQAESIQEDEALRYKICKVGQKVRHNIYGKGTVIKSTWSTVKIEFESGKIATFDLNKCVTGKMIKLL